jgi:peptidoglycan/xylan/chitin deacetylase (PgdA/CDA1 family)
MISLSSTNLITQNNSHQDSGRARRFALKFAARTLWRAPGRFGIARTLDPSYSLRCVVFHNISETESPFTKGMRVSITPRDLEAALRYLARNYTPVSLQDVLDESTGRLLPRRAVLVTFDDGYSSVVEQAAGLCRKFNVPAICFLNAATLDNRRFAPDNLVCYVANELGIETINEAVRAVTGTEISKVTSVREVFARLFPALSLPARHMFLDALAHLARINEPQLAAQAGLYLTSKHVRELASANFEIGNHTYTHVHCRSLTPEDFSQEIDRNKAELEAASKRKIRSFSLPYGSSADLTSALEEHLKLSGHQAVFLSESVSNPGGANRWRFDRVSTRAGSDHALFFDIEILPRLRAIRNRHFRSDATAWAGRKAPSETRLAGVRG